ncbi:hypothetical protein IAR55_006632 [Kwoniella newhampshirensis]|uniref:Uncharacterized protein n=1 Tax=Kwoniella newhampshirensis TaxID=1651941 RepID=A0AAW0YTJ8_9TREE
MPANKTTKRPMWPISTDYSHAMTPETRPTITESATASPSSTSPPKKMVKTSSPTQSLAKTTSSPGKKIETM